MKSFGPMPAMSFCVFYNLYIMELCCQSVCLANLSPPCGGGCKRSLAIVNTDFFSFFFSLSANCFSPTSRVPKKLIFYGHSYLAQREGICINIQIISTITLLILNIYLANHAVLGEISSSRITLFRAKYLAEIIGSGEVKIIIPPC